MDKYDFDRFEMDNTPQVMMDLSYDEEVVFSDELKGMIHTRTLLTIQKRESRKRAMATRRRMSMSSETETKSATQQLS